MFLSVAIQRVKDGLGFRTGTALDSRITLRFQEAQRDLEKGKTLPRFLLQEDQTLLLAAAAHTVAVPAGFLRDDDDNPIHYTPSGTDKPFFLSRRQTYRDAVEANIKEDNDPVGPKVYVIRKSVIDFITAADTSYSLTWNYYKAADILTTDIENAWLANAPEWLIGEAGLRMAKPLRDKDAMQDFTEMRSAGRAAIFGDQIALEESGGPWVMGADL